MTLTRLNETTNGLLTADNTLTEDPEAVLGLLEMAFSDVIAHADALHLMTLNRTGNIFRLAQGKYVVRMPELPTTDEDELDLDNELCFAVARLMASYMSEKKSSVHCTEAKRLIRNYDSKVFEILEALKGQGGGTSDASPTRSA